MKPLVTMRRALEDPDLFGAILAGESWASWRVLLIALMGEELTEAERESFAALTGREKEPLERVEEVWAIIGRRGGKTRAIAVLGAYLAALVDYSDILAPGERASLPIMSASVWQAGKAKQYLDGIFAHVPAFKELVTNETSDTIILSTRVDIEVRPASFRTARSGTCAAAICDEVAFWRSENTANPDTEILNALRPSLATTGGLLACISSPYARRGELYNTWKRDFGPNGDSAILVAKAASRTMNPLLSEKVVTRAYERDAAVASAEYGGEFRTDVETFVNADVVEAAVVPGCFERAPLADFNYHGFADPSGGSADSMTLAVAHNEGGVAVLDAIREVKPPFSPEAVVADFAALLKTYRIGKIRGDRYAGIWPSAQFAKNGVAYVPADKTKSEIYLQTLPLINSGRVSLLDDKKLVAQLCGLERRTARGGKDSVDHAPGGHDDRVNAAAGALLLAQEDAGSLARLGDFLIGGEAAPEPEFPRAVVASIARGVRGEHVGRAGAAIFAHRPAGTPAKMILLDVISGDFGAPFLGEVFRRLQLWSDRLKPNFGFGALAEDEVSRAYNSEASRILMEQGAQGRFDHNAKYCKNYPAKMLARGDLAATAAGIVASGGVKIGGDLLAESARRPIGSLLDMRAGDDADPLKTAIFLGVIAGFPETGH